MSYYIKTTRGWGCMINGYMYGVYSKRGNLRCYEYKKGKCKGTATSKEGKVITKHNHLPRDLTPFYFRVRLMGMAQDLRYKEYELPQIYDLARQCEYNRIEVERGTEAAKAAIADLPKFDSMRSSMQRAKNEPLPVAPTTRQALSFENFKDQFLTVHRENFLIHDTGSEDPDRMLIFSSTANLKVLCSSDTWYVKGTSCTVDFIFDQLFTVHAHIHDQLIPLVYALLPNRDRVTYLRFFEILNDQIRVRNIADKEIRDIVTDFDLELAAAIRECYLTRVNHRGYYNHFQQAIGNAIRRYCMPPCNDIEIRQLYDKVTAIAKVPAESKPKYDSTLTSDARLTQFLKTHFHPHWCDERRRKMWDWSAIVAVCACIAIEEWHNSFNGLMGTRNLNIFELLISLKNEYDGFARVVKAQEINVDSVASPIAQIVTNPIAPIWDQGSGIRDQYVIDDYAHHSERQCIQAEHGPEAAQVAIAALPQFDSNRSSMQRSRKRKALPLVPTTIQELSVKVNLFQMICHGTSMGFLQIEVLISKLKVQCSSNNSYVEGTSWALHFACVPLPANQFGMYDQIISRIRALQPNEAAALSEGIFKNLNYHQCFSYERALGVQSMDHHSDPYVPPPSAQNMNHPQLEKQFQTIDHVIQFGINQLLPNKVAEDEPLFKTFSTQMRALYEYALVPQHIDGQSVPCQPPLGGPNGAPTQPQQQQVGMVAAPQAMPAPPTTHMNESLPDNPGAQYMPGQGAHYDPALSVQNMERQGVPNVHNPITTCALGLMDENLLTPTYDLFGSLATNFPEQYAWPDFATDNN